MTPVAFVQLPSIYMDPVNRTFVTDTWVRVDEIVAVHLFGDPGPSGVRARVVLRNGQTYETTLTAAEVCKRLVEATDG